VPDADTDTEHGDGEQPDAGPAGRPIWSGTLSFGLVSVPVNLFPAQRSSAPSLRWLDGDGTPLARRYYCPAHDAEADSEHLVRGFELENGDHVVLEDDELAALAPKKSRDIDLRLFVKPEAIDPLYFERAYVMAPAGESVKAYRLLAEVMERKRHAGIATFVMREKEYLVAIFAQGGLLRVETLRFADELRSPEAVGLPEKHAAEPERVRAFARAIDELAESKLAPEELADASAERVRELALRKQAHGQDVIEGAEPQALAANAEVIDMMEMLKQSLKQKAPASKTAAAPRRGKRKAGNGKNKSRAARR
jgi:DNA end-binding protein Ku